MSGSQSENESHTNLSLHTIEKVLSTHGVNCPPNNMEIYKRAFIHKSAVENGMHSKSNERLEFLGDGVLEMVTKEYLYKRFPYQNEGFMTEKKIALVKNEHIGQLGLKLGLDKHVVLGQAAESKNVRLNIKQLGCLFEALIGAIFLDFGENGYQVARLFITSVYHSYVDWNVLITTNDNYKNKLQVLIQKSFKTTPSYVELNRSPSRGYKVGVYLCRGANIQSVNLRHAVDLSSHSNSFLQVIGSSSSKLFFLGTGCHKVKKKAEQAACKDILERLKG